MPYKFRFNIYHSSLTVIITLPNHSGLGPDPKPKLRGDARTFRVWLDPNQYQQDMTSSIQSGTEDPYETFNVIMRRKPKENNFKVWTIHWSTQISPRCTLHLSTLSSDLELWSYQHHPRVMYSTYYTLLGVVAVRLGPGQLWDYHPLKALDTSHWIFMWYAPLPSSHL